MSIFKAMIKLFMFYFTRRVAFDITNFFAPDSELQIVELISKLSAVTPIITILDIGGGSGVVWKNKILLKMINDGKISVTIFDAKINESSDITFISGVAPGGLSIFEDNSFNLCICCDVIEHLPKSDGYSLLYNIETISSMKAYIFAPNGFVKQPPERNNPYNAHISSWSVREIRKFGWDSATGLGGFKFFYSEYGLPRYNSDFKIFHYLLILFSLFSRLVVFKLTRRWSYSFSGVFSKIKSENSINLGRISN